MTPQFENASVTVSDNDSYLVDPIGSASRSFQNEGFLSGSADPAILDAEFGFSQPEFRTEQLAGSVDLYHRHVFLCYKSLQVWPPRIEAAEFDRLPRLLSAAVSARKSDMRKEVSYEIRFLLGVFADQFWRDHDFILLSILTNGYPVHGPKYASRQVI